LKNQGFYPLSIRNHARNTRASVTNLDRSTAPENTMKLSHPALLGVLILQPVYAQLPLPPDVAVVAPSETVPKSLSAFSGKWAGQWGRTLDHLLVVEKIDGRSAVFIYSHGTAPSWGITQPNFVRVTGEFRDDGSLRGTLPNGAWVTYKMSADGESLDGEYVRGGVTRGVFKRER
jgi:hypothetical protein